MGVSDAEVERIARDLIARHGRSAARVAAERLNERIDRGDASGRDLWACVVHAIHARQGSGPVWAGRSADWRDLAPRLAAVR